MLRTAKNLKCVVKVGDVMVTMFYFASVVVLALSSALWVRITQRDLETSRTRAREAHLNWLPVEKSKSKNRHALR